jgi:1-deoxy-D-xylulose-5-phosphate synthase
MSPSNENECRKMLTTGYQYKGLAAVRYPRGSGTGAKINSKLEALPIGKAEVIRETTIQDDKKVTILAFGSMVASSLQAADKLNATVINMRFIKPLDITLIKKMAETHDLVVTVEENALMGGAGSAVLEALQRLSIPVPTLCLGLPDIFIEHGIHETMLAECGLDSAGITSAIENKLKLIDS